MRIGGDIGFEEDPLFGPGRGRQHGDASIAGEEPVPAPDGVAVLCAPVLRRRYLFGTRYRRRPPHPAPDPAAEISRLRRENDRLRTERDILKRLWRSISARS